MKNSKILLFYIALCFSFRIFAADEITYVKIQDSGFKILTAEEFNKCEKIIYRDIAVSQLSLMHKKKLLKAIIKAETVNKFESLKQHVNACSYYIKRELSQ